MLAAKIGRAGLLYNRCLQIAIQNGMSLHDWAFDVNVSLFEVDRA